MNQFALVLGVLSCLCVPPALSATSASAVFSKFGYELVDLDPNDGVTPWISFSTGYDRGSTAATVITIGADTWILDRQESPVGWGSALASNAGSHSGINYAAKAEVGSDSLFASAQTVTSLTSKDDIIRNLSSAQSHQNGFFAPALYNFSFSPRTRVTLFGTATLSAAATQGINLEAGLFEYAVAGALLQIEGPENFAIVTDSATAFGSYASYDDNGKTVYSPTSEAFERILSVSVDNLSSANAVGSMYAHIGVGASVFALPVPEPAHWGMLTLGAVLVGLSAIRQQHRGRQSLGEAHDTDM